MYLHLVRPSDGAISETRAFHYVPSISGSAVECPYNNSHLLQSKLLRPNFQLYSHILALDSASLARHIFRTGETPVRDKVKQTCSISVQCNLPDKVHSADAETCLSADVLPADRLQDHSLTVRAVRNKSVVFNEVPQVVQVDAIEVVGQVEVEVPTRGVSDEVTQMVVDDSAALVKADVTIDSADVLVERFSSEGSRPTSIQVDNDSCSPPPLPQKGLVFGKLKENLAKSVKGGAEAAFDPYAKIQRIQGRVKSVNFDRTSIATTPSDGDVRFSMASSEDLNSRLSAAFSDCSDLTDVRSIYSDVSDVASLVSSTHTLNDRLSLVSESDTELSDSDQTVIDGSSEVSVVDTIERQLEMLQSMSVDHDFQTYSSFQMAMKHPVDGWPVNFTMRDPDQPTEAEIDAVLNDLVYDDPSDIDVQSLQDLLLEPTILPAVPPRVESMVNNSSRAAFVGPPLPPRRFRKINQPLPDPPVKDLGLKSALMAIKQTFRKSSKPAKTDSVANASPYSSHGTLYNSQENVADAAKNKKPPTATLEDVKETDVVVAVVNDAPLEKAEAAEVPADAESKVVVAFDLDDQLTEAENYALYMRLAPLATASEFDEGESMSLIYADLSPTKESHKGQGQP